MIGSVLTALALTSSFWVWDLTKMPPGFRQPQFELYSSDKLATDQVHFWIERDLGAHEPSKATLDYLRLRMTLAIETEREIFGAQPTSPSGDRDFHILIAAIPPYEKNGKKFGFDGFFNVFDQLSEAAALEQEQHSNERNIIYVNALQDLNTPYMHGVVAHEMNHLITHGQYDEETNALDPWLNELLGEAAMQVTGYFTDVNHVSAYRAHPEWPLAVNGYGISYGGTSLFAEFLIARFGEKKLGEIARAKGNGFERVSAVYGTPWNELFAEYVHWLYEKAPSESKFTGRALATREATETLSVGSSGVTFLTGEVDAKIYRVTAVPAACSESTNVIRSAFVYGETNATALWIESTPPCPSNRGGEGYEKDAFTLIKGNGAN